MALKVVVANKVGIKVKGTTQDEDGREVPFEFVLLCNRLTNAEMKSVMSDQAESIAQFFEKQAYGWRGQTLVTDDGVPADFSLEALQTLFTIKSMDIVCWQAYITQAGANAKN
jgi:hypothetical protein